MEKNIFRYTINNSIEIISYDQLTVRPREGKLPSVELEGNRPLVVLLQWLNAQPRHVNKFVDLYLNKGFDVMRISLKVWQLLWPTFGSHVVAGEILEFLYEHVSFQPVLVHAFSCGAYLWSEVLVKAGENMEKYRPLLKRIKGQVIDSPPSSPPRFQQGFATALFPNNPLLHFLFRIVITIQLFVFYNAVTKHLLKGYEVAHYPPARIPSLMLISKDDPISPFDLNLNMVETWKSNGIEAYLKWWESSPHVGHYVRHKEEYLEHLNLLLDAVGLNNLTGPKKVN